MNDVSEWKRQLELERQQKDQFFMIHPQSPLSMEARSKLKGGLSYYPPDPAYRFELELHKHANQEMLKVQATKGEMREFIRWGEFRFRIGDQSCTLQAYKSDPHEDRLFVLFRDATSGKETYGAGRYLDLEPETHRTPNGKWVLDLNKAYNPWCAYSEFYTCPLVPPENWLKVPVRAGEKDFQH